MKLYFPYISPYDLASLGTLFMGMTVALLLAFAKRPGHAANLFLSSALAVIVLKVSGLAPFLLPALGPLLYFYVRQLTLPDRRFRWKDMLHFPPPLLAGYWLPTWPVLILVIIYLYLSHRLIESFYRRLRPVLMDKPRFAFRRLDRALLLLGLLCLLSMSNDLFCFTVAFALIAMAVEAMLKAGNGVQLTMPMTDRSDAREKSRRLKEDVAANRFYEDAELTLTTLAVKLSIHPHDMSRIINLGMEKNFNDFINEFRVREVARRMQDPASKRLTLLGIAYESGFNSQRTFNRVFKEMTGKTPAEYKNMLEKELPNDKLAALPRIRPVILRTEITPKWSQEKLNRNVMFRNYLKIAVRNFSRHWLFTMINVTGLSIGISVALVIYLFVHFDFSFDKFHPDSDKIYRVVSNYTFAGESVYNGGSCGPLPEAAKNQIAGLAASAPFFTLEQTDVIIPGISNAAVKFRKEKGIILADQRYFNMFPYKWVAGSAKTSLNEPYTVVLTVDQAKKYFPSLPYEQIIGKTVIYWDIKTTVTGIVEQFNENTVLQFNDFISYSTGVAVKSLKDNLQLTDWAATRSSSQFFVKLEEKVSVSNIERELNNLLKKNEPKIPANKGNTHELRLEKLADLHFDAQYSTYDERTADKTTLYGLSIIALFLLSLGCINFINLTTAQSSQRAKETGIRKTLGSTRGQLILQFLSETFLITLFGVLISVACAPFILKLFSDFIPAGVKADYLRQPDIFIFLFLLTVVVSLVSGFYPAVILTGNKPAFALKNKAFATTGKTRKAWLRKSLTVTQFAIAQFFIIATILVSKQIYYALHKDLGFKKDAIVYVNTPYSDRQADNNRKLVFMNKLRSIPQVELISAGGDPVSSDNGNTNEVTYKNGKIEIKTSVDMRYGDENYIKVYQVKLLAGRDLRPGDALGSWLVNATFARTLGFNNPADAVGKFISDYDKNKIQIVGIVADFYSKSLHSPIKPLAIFTETRFQNGTLHIALKPQTTKGNEWRDAIAGMEQSWKEIYPNDVFEYHFFDESIAKYYESEQHTLTLLTWATVLSIFISCLGLLGLTIYTTNQRTKEIGVRKVLGASVVQIVTLLSTELLLLIVLAFVIVAPVGWWAMSKWMQSFADHTAISWWIFALSGTGMLLLALFASGFQTVKAALMNPVKSLRSE